MADFSCCGPCLTNVDPSYRLHSFFFPPEERSGGWKAPADTVNLTERIGAGFPSQEGLHLSISPRIKLRM